MVQDLELEIIWSLGITWELPCAVDEEDIGTRWRSVEGSKNNAVDGCPPPPRLQRPLRLV
jgi:hypothetical protein